MLKDKMKELRETLIAQANTVERMLHATHRGIAEGDTAALREIVSVHEPVVNKLELQVDQRSINILALYHPEAKDLRAVMMMSKMTSDLERMGDCAVNIAESSLFLAGRPPFGGVYPERSRGAQDRPLGFKVELAVMAGETTRMVTDGIAAFIGENADLARDVCRRDSTVDALRDKIWKELSCLNAEDDTTIEAALHVLRVANNFEKIADVSTNIAEETVFLAAGSVIKHHREDAPDSSIYH